ncbi:MAG: phosphoenolpyruvate synthase [Acidiferrobacterales bacterium]|nr:phosphoenolpyruvate synthase [Acidiferrobacterales bacterium]
MSSWILWFKDLGMEDVPVVGGKNASLGEMIANLANAGISVPNGFATTADAYRAFVNHEGLADKINQRLDGLNVDNVADLQKAGAEIRSMMMEHPLPPELDQAIREGYAEMGGSVAVRSSATAEDLPEASFAGQQETFLNVAGIDQVLHCVREVFASLFNDRAIAYRVHQGFAHADVALSAGIQRMVRSDLGASGVMFTIDTESGFEDAVFITASWGLGECVVQGSVNPDEFYVYKPALAAGKPAILRRNRGSKLIKMVYADAGQDNPVEIVDVPEDEQFRFSINDEDVEALAKMAMTIGQHYGRPMDIEWGKDGETGELMILQARPETVRSRDHKNTLERYQLNQTSKVLVTGRSVGQRVGSGKVRLVPSIDDLDKVQAGDILVTDMTDPDWEPVMKRASAIVTNRGGRTCHAAIIARELGVPAIVGCEDATQVLSDGAPVTVSCAEGDTGNVYEGELEFDVISTDLDKMPDLPFKISMNVGNPERAFAFSRIPNHGVGLARLEFIINNTIGVHPRALLEKDSLPVDMAKVVDRKMAGYASPASFYIEKLVEGIASLGAAFFPKPVIVRLSDFKSNEYANLVGGSHFEPDEENPMLGFRGASRYISNNFRPSFEMECEALRRVRNEMGLTNIEVMVPFVRTLNEADSVISLLAENGLKRGENGLRVIMMCEIPSNAVLADQFLERFDGFSIGSNDLTQFTLGLDRDSAIIAHLFDERDEAVKAMLAMAIQACRKADKYVGICGQGPSDHPDLANWLMEQGISSVSLNPDTVIETWLFLAKD